MAEGGEGGGGEGGGGVEHGEGRSERVEDVVQRILLRCQQDFLKALGNTWVETTTGARLNQTEHLGTTMITGGGGGAGGSGEEGGVYQTVYPTSGGAQGGTEVIVDGEYNVCDHCNFSESEMETLLTSGTCTPSDFSSYMPVIYQMYACIFVIALLGNTLVLYTVAASKKMHTVTNLFIANLAVGDLLIMVLCVPFSVASIIVLQYWPFGETLCVFVNYSQRRE